MIVYFVKRN